MLSVAPERYSVASPLGMRCEVSLPVSIVPDSLTSLLHSPVCMSIIRIPSLSTTYMRSMITMVTALRVERRNGFSAGCHAHSYPVGGATLASTCDQCKPNVLEGAAEVFSGAGRRHNTLPPPPPPRPCPALLALVLLLATSSSRRISIPATSFRKSTLLSTWYAWYACFSDERPLKPTSGVPCSADLPPVTSIPDSSVIP
mmetsp:Transcript_27893/g.45299  ORF Transcript_27893/g.45299 Transcript_27893/m.45299 type:complete len:200 (-) Transcript_27893:198-797(-)